MNRITYIFVVKKNDINTVNYLIENNPLNLKKKIFVLWNNSMETYFREHGLKYLLISDYTKDINLDSLKKKLLKFVENFPHEKILNEKSLVELLEYNGYSMWWFVRQGFYEQLVGVMKEIYVVRSLVNKNNIKRILLLNNDEEFISIVQESTKGIRLRIVINNEGKNLEKTNHLIKIKKLFFGSLPRIIRIFQGFTRSFQIKMQHGKKNVLLFTQDWTNLSESIRGDHNSYTILRELLRKNEHNVLPLDVVIDKNAQWKSIREKKWPFVPYDYFIFRSYFDVEITKNIGFLRQRLRKAWNRLDEDNKLKKTLTYNGIDLSFILKPKIKSYFFNRFDSFLSAARNMEVSKKLIENYNIDITICIDENGNSRFLVFASHMCNIPSVGLQHGVIAPIKITYDYNKKDLHCYKNKLNCILAEKTAVFGKKFKDLLIKNGNYRQDQIAITGQPRTDIFYENKNKYSKKSLCRKFGVDHKKKLVVFASQPFEDSSEPRTALIEIVKSLRNIKNVELVVKLHVDDDSSFYNEILSHLKYKAIVTKDTDLYSLLFCSDLVVSISSTVILEASVMGKPVIQLNLIENYDFFGDMKNKAFIKITNKKDLPTAIKRSLFDESFSKKIKIKREKSILEYYHRIDGKATERFLNVVDELLENKKTGKKFY